jgi:hypothetical protein
MRLAVLLPWLLAAFAAAAPAPYPQDQDQENDPSDSATPILTPFPAPTIPIDLSTSLNIPITSAIVDVPTPFPDPDDVPTTTSKSKSKRPHWEPIPIFTKECKCDLKTARYPCWATDALQVRLFSSLLVAQIGIPQTILPLSPPLKKERKKEAR